MDHSWAKPGVKCILVEPNPEWDGPDMLPFIAVPETETVYTVREVRVIGGEPCLVLDEIRNGPMIVAGPPNIRWEPCFSVRRFRPLVTRSQEHDTALFAPLLNTRELAQ